VSTSRAAPEQLHPLATLDRVVHSPARLMIVTTLYTLESADFIFLMNLTDLTWGNLSSHLSVLEEADYVEIEKTFKGKRATTMISLTPAGREAFREYREQLQEVFEQLPE